MIRHMLQNIVGKELRELRVWSAMLFAGYSLGLLGSPGGGLMSEGYRSTQFLFATTYGSALIGIILGLLQTVPERRMGLWPFMAHRPLESHWMFSGKVIAGCILYVAIVGIPTLVFNVWYAIPGHMAAPYYLAMALPGFVDVLTGFVYYFAAFALGCSEVRRMHVGILGLGLPVATSFAANGFSHVIYVVAVLAVAIVVSMYVALQSFALPRRDRGGRRLHAVATMSMALPGVVVAYIFAICCLSPFLAMVNTYEQYHQYQYLALDGTPLITTMAGNTITEIRTIDGVRMTELEQKILAPNANPHRILVTLGYAGPIRQPGYREESSLIRTLNNDYMRDDLWYWSEVDRVAYLYSRRSRQRMLTLELPRVELTQAHGERFNIIGAARRGEQIELLFPDGVYHLVQATGSGTITRLKSTPDGERIVSTGGTYSWDEAAKEDRGDSVLITDSNKICLLRDDLPWFALPLGFEVDSVADLGERFVVTSTDITTGVRSYLTYDMTGKILAEVKVDTMQPVSMWGVFVGALVIPGLSMVGAGVLFLVSALHAQGEELTLLSAFVTVALVSGVASVIWGNRRLTSAGFDGFNRWMWGLVNFLGGPASLLWMRYQLEWPVTIECEECHRSRRVVRDTCEHCDAAHALPVRDGTEILV